LTTGSIVLDVCKVRLISRRFEIIVFLKMGKRQTYKQIKSDWCVGALFSREFLKWMPTCIYCVK